MNKRFQGLIFSLVGASFGILMFHLPLWRGPMYGDDFLGVFAAQNTNGQSGFFSDIWLVGSGKWRPVTTPILMWMGRTLGYSYLPFQLTNLALLLLCAVLVGYFAYLSSGSRLVSGLCSFAVSVSHFTWMAQISIYGLMELLAIIFLIGAIGIAIISVDLPVDRFTLARRLQLLAAFLLLLSTFTHERYLLTTMSFWGLYLWGRPANTELRRRSFVFLLIPATHIFLKGVLLGLDPLQGGGESRVRTVAGGWIFKHLTDSLLGLFGYFSGASKFYSAGELTRLAEQSDLKITGVLIIMVPSVVVVLGTLKAYRNQHSGPINDLSKTHFLFIFSLIITTIAPAATVAQRIEMRWLLAPQILLILLSTIFLSRSRLNGAQRLVSMLVLPLCFSCLSLLYLGKNEAYTILRNQPSKVLSDLEKKAPVAGDWILELAQSDASVPTNWQFGFGFSLLQLTNPPYRITASQDNCRTAPKAIPCISVVLHGANMNFKIRSRVRD